MTVAHRELSDEKIGELESFLTDWMSNERVPGLSLALLREGELVYADGFGARNLEENHPASANTLYAVASVTKSFTALSLLQLVERGEVALDDPVEDYVPYLDNVSGEEVTLHQLLAHSSGMPSDGTSVALIGRSMGLSPIEVPMSDSRDHQIHVRESADQRVTDREDPYFYYNSGYNILSNVVETVTGQPFPDVVQNRILSPLGMERSTFSLQEFRESSDVMTPYRKEDGESRKVDLPVKGFLHGAGGLISSVLDLSRYLRLYLNNGVFDDTRLLSEELFERMLTRHTHRGSYIDGTDIYYGYGWGITTFLGEPLIGHSGSVSVSTAYAGFQPERGTGVAVGCNTGHDYSLSVIGKAALALLADEDPEDVVSYFSLQSKFDDVAGSYSSYRGIMDAELVPQGGRATLHMETDLGEDELVLYPETLDPDDYRFYAVTNTGKRMEVRVEKQNGGNVLFVDRWRLEED